MNTRYYMVDDIEELLLILRDMIIMVIFEEFLSFRDYILKISWLELKKIILVIVENVQMGKR